MITPTPTKEYIGDGVYIDIDPSGLLLETPRETVHWMVLEPSMIEALVRYCKQHNIIP